MRGLQQALLREGLCDWCIKRYVKRPSEKVLESAKANRGSCKICGGAAFYNYSGLLEGLKGRTFRTYDVGVRLSQSMLKAEEDLVLKYGISGYKPLKRALRKKIIEEIRGKVKAVLTGRRPEVVLVFDVLNKGLEVVERSYQLCVWLRKEGNVRLMAAPCGRCGGRGCSYCAWTGKEKDGSVESYFLFDFPRAYGTSSPVITWPFKEIPGLQILGNGVPVYMSFSSVLDRVHLPLKISFRPAEGVTLTQAYSLSSRLEYRRRYIATLEVLVELERELAQAELKEIYKSRSVKLIGARGKTWLRSLRVLSAETSGRTLKIKMDLESGVSIYALFGLRSEATVKRLEGQLLPDGLVKRILGVKVLAYREL